MSNAMRSGKRALAGVAAGALALGVLSIAGASTATAAKNVKPSVTTGTASASIGPVRYSTTASTQDPVLGSPFLFSAVGTDDSKVTTDDTVVVTLQVAPSAASKLWLDKTAGVSFPSGGIAADDTLTLSSSTADDSIGALNPVFTLQPATSTDDTVLSTFVAVSEGGTYSGKVEIYDGAVAQGATGLIQTTTFAFTTAGKPASLVLDPTAVSMVASTSDTETITASVKDASGNLTAISPTIDSFTVTSGTPAVATVNTGTLNAESFDDSTATTLGTTTFKITATATAGTSTVTVKPLGTLPGSGVTSQTVAVTTSATGPTAPTTLAVTSPTSQINDDTILDDTLGYDVNRALVTSLVITGTGATPSAGQTVLVSTSNSSWTGLKVDGVSVANNATATPVLASADASGNLTLGVSWTSVANNGKLTVQTGTGSKAKWVVVDVIDASADSSSSPAGAIIKKTGEATDFEVTLTDDFGNAYVGYRVTGKSVSNTGTPSGSSSSVGTTDSTGKATISVPAPSSTFTGAATVTFTVLTPGGGATSGLAPATVAVTYSASGDVTSITVSQAQTNGGSFGSTTTALTTYPTMLVPYGGVASNTTVGTYTVADASGTAAGNVATFQASASPANSVTVTVPEGVKVSKTATTAWNGGSQSLTVASGTTVYVFATKVGTHDVTFTSGTITATGKVKVSTTNNAAYNIAVSPESQTLSTGAIGTAVVTITDVFGNPVPSTTDDSGGVTASATGEILLSGYSATQKLTTNTSGQATITILAGGSAGDGSIAIVPTAKNNAWASTYTPPTGAPAPVTSAAAIVKVTSAPTAKTIVITGERGTVKGRPGIMVDGITTGFAEGDKVVPWIKFPGQTEYSAGTARPAIDADGEFYWQRKTGKKIYIYFKNEDGTVKSDRIIIQAK